MGRKYILAAGHPLSQDQERQKSKGILASLQRMTRDPHCPECCAEKGRLG